MKYDEKNVMCFVIPAASPAFFSLRAGGAFLVSAEARGGEIAYGIVRSIAGNPCRIANPFGGQTRVRDLETGEAVAFEKEGDVLRFATEAGHEYAVERETRPLESFEMIE